VVVYLNKMCCAARDYRLSFAFSPTQPNSSRFPSSLACPRIMAWSRSSSVVSAALLSLASLTSATHYDVNVGLGGKVFNPEVLTAQVGDDITYHFFAQVCLVFVLLRTCIMKTDPSRTTPSRSPPSRSHAVLKQQASSRDLSLTQRLL
jgi:hypothetical protein